MEYTKRQIKIKFILWMFLFLLFSGGIREQNTNFVWADTTVYVTPTGSKYHTHACGYGSYYPASLSEALARGLSPCSKCYGGGSGGSSDVGGGSGSSGGVCGGYVPPETVKPMEISQTSLLMLKGQTKKLKIKNAPGKVKWSSSKKSVASVSSSGKIKARKKGKTLITANAGGKKKTCKVTVEAPKLNMTSVSVNLWESRTLKLSGCKHSIKWKSSDSDIVKVKKGTITAREEGRATISAKVHGKSYKCKVEVKKPLVKKVILSKSSVKMEYNENMKFNVQADPRNSLDYYDVEVRSLDPSIVEASLDWFYDDVISLKSKGKEGKTVVYVTIGSVTAVCQVTVAKPVVTKLKAAQTSIRLKPDEEKELKYEYAPSNAFHYYDLKWNSKNEKIVKVKRSWGYANRPILQAVSEGETDVTLTLGNKSVTCHVVVAKPEITKLELEETEIRLKPNEQKNLSYEYAPTDANKYYDLEIEMADESIVEAEQAWYNEEIIIFEGKAEGETDVTLTLGNKSVTCHVVVAKPEITKLELEETEIRLKPNEQKNLSYEYAPTDANKYYDLEIEMADESIVEAEQAWYNEEIIIFEGKAEGETDVTLTLGNKSVICHVIVAP